MSLINEALKRAKQAHDQHPRIVVGEAPLQPAVEATSSRPLGAMVLSGIGILALVLAVWFFLFWWRSPRALKRIEPSKATAVAAAAPTPSASVGTKAQPPFLRPSTTPANPSKSAPSAVVTHTLTSSVPQISQNPAPKAPPKEPIATASLIQHAPAVSESGTKLAGLPPKPVEGPAPMAAEIQQAMAALRLQGIFYRTAKASALINGHTLFVGDEVDKAKVIAIERSGVRVCISGVTNTLYLR